MKCVIFGLMALIIAVVQVAISMAVTTSKVQEAQSQIFSICPTTECSGEKLRGVYLEPDEELSMTDA